MVEPFRAVMKNGHAAYFVLAGITYVISLFFWPTPAVPLVSAVLLPAAIAAGLPPLGGALAIAIAGQGMALSSDYVIGVAPGISAKAAGAAVSAAVVADRALVLSLITGIIALVLAYLSIRKSIRQPSNALLERWQTQSANGELARIEAEGTFDKAEIARGTGYEERQPLVTDAQVAKSCRRSSGAASGWSKVFAVATPLAFLCVIALMVLSKFGIGRDLKGGEAAALVGGVAAVLMILASFATDGPRKALDASADHVTEGFVFAFRAMGSVLPIAGFFFLGAGGDLAASILNVPVGASAKPAVRADPERARLDPGQPRPGRVRRADRRDDHRHRRLRLRRPAAHGIAFGRSGAGRRPGSRRRWPPSAKWGRYGPAAARWSHGLR